MAQWSRIHLTMQESQILSLVQEDPLEKEMEIHSSILTWEILWTGEPDRYSLWGLKKSRT